MAGSYCSLVERRWRDFVHCWRAVRLYRIARPILMKGGPSPRIRAFASQDRETFKALAASRGCRSGSIKLARAWIFMPAPFFNEATAAYDEIVCSGTSSHQSDLSYQSLKHIQQTVRRAFVAKYSVFGEKFSVD
jgi:hypothetical protein